MADFESLKALYTDAGQAQVFTFWDTLSSPDKQALLTQLASIEPNRVRKIFTRATAPSDTSADSSLAPPPSESTDSLLRTPEKGKHWREVGLKAIKDGKVGVLLLAGGQGTRLGSKDPKGCYDIGLPSGKSLFQLQGEKIKRLQVVAGGATIPWYVMTSGPTRKATESYFRQNAFFGLDESNVIFFEQGVLPAMDSQGKFFLETPSSIAVAPDGNGGLYAGLRSTTTSSAGHSVLEDLKKRGITSVHAYCVDNCLVRVADPVFLGYCMEKQAECGVKVVRKMKADESVGVVAKRGGKWGVVEYSEIPAELSEAKDSSGDLTYRAANIANHYYTTDFLSKIESFEADMAYHVAHKKIPHLPLNPPSTVLEKPTKPNGIKLELFIFDVLPFTPSLAILEVDRKSEFSPLKNAPGTGVDDPECSKRDLLEMHKGWLENAGWKVEGEVEVGAGVSYDGEGLEGGNGKTLKGKMVVESKEQLEKA